MTVITDLSASIDKNGDIILSSIRNSYGETQMSVFNLSGLVRTIVREEIAAALKAPEPKP